MPASLLLVVAAHASPAGKVGVTSSGCSCHGAASSAVAVALAADADTVDPGDTVQLSLTVTKAGAVRAGLDVSASTGTLAAGEGTQLVREEVTQSSPALVVDGAVTWAFSWTAVEPGPATLRAVGLAADGQDGEHGDTWDFAEPLRLTVTGEVPDPPDSGGDSAADDSGASGDDPPPCGCGAEPGAAAGVVAVALVLVSARRR